MMIDNINFDVFDESLGVDGYYSLIRDVFFPNSTPESFDLALFPANERYYPKGSLFSRVRRIDQDTALKFYNGYISLSDFYPPNPKKINTSEGRFNAKNESIFYLADHPYVAMKECDISVNDYFLLSYFSSQKKMCFLEVENGNHPLSNLMYRLFLAKDKRFYPVINLVYSNLLKFDKYDGLVYKSVKVVGEHKIKGNWEGVSSIINLAITSENIKNFKFELSWMNFCDSNYMPVQYSIFYPLSPKKSKKLFKLNFLGNKKKFISISMVRNEELHIKYRKSKGQLHELKVSDQIPFKTVMKL
ncbi:RES domain-containing protein [Brenneria corticis]|nr:RES domain-containing protein [Brenneria sp. CFCC 11842]